MKRILALCCALVLALGMLGAWVSCFLTGYAGPSAIFQSMLFAYTWLWPDQMVLLFGIIRKINAAQTLKMGED